MKINVDYIDTKDRDGYSLEMVMLDDHKTIINCGGRSYPF